MLMLVVKALAEMVPPMQRLEQLNLSHNPVCSANRMRQNVLMWGPVVEFAKRPRVISRADVYGEEL